MTRGWCARTGEQPQSLDGTREGIEKKHHCTIQSNVLKWRDEYKYNQNVLLGCTVVQCHPSSIIHHPSCDRNRKTGDRRTALRRKPMDSFNRFQPLGSNDRPNDERLSRRVEGVKGGRWLRGRTDACGRGRRAAHLPLVGVLHLHQHAPP